MQTSARAIGASLHKESTAASGQGGKKSKAAAGSKSLAISPNLDKLLEHEERLGRLKTRTVVIVPTEMVTPEIDSPESPMAMGTSAEYPIGLPPPPRHSRKNGAPRSPLSPWMPANIGGSSEHSPDVQENSRRSGLRNPVSSQSNPYINPAPTAEEIFKSRDTASATPASQQSNLSDSIPQNAAPVQEQSKIPPPSRRRNLSKLKPAKRLLVKSTTPEMQQIVGDDGAWQRRPLISHGQRWSMSSEDSAHSSSTRPASSTYSPTRISISSTIYPASSAESHTNTLFNDPPLDPAALRVSFMEIYSPTNSQFNIDSSGVGPPAGHISPIQFAAPETPSEDDSIDSSFNLDFNIPSPKPPIPTTPKPNFSRPSLRSKQSSPRDSPPNETTFYKPATTNFLDIDERSDLVRKSRKLTRVFGETPDADAMVHQDTGRSASQSTTSLRRKPKDKDGVSSSRSRPTPATIRRHSMPLTPDAITFIDISSSPNTGTSVPPSPRHREDRRRKPKRDIAQSGTHQEAHSIRSNSPVSFIDLSDELSISKASLSPSQSLFDAMSVDQEDDDRRRKRERLAKLHRFLGSRVPAHLVLGFDEDSDATLPPPHRTPSPGDANTRRPWIKRRRSSSVVLHPSNWAGDLGRAKAELDDKEKAINVRRAQKMEKVFGVAPPLTLYHTRHAPTPSAPPSLKTVVPRAAPTASSFIPSAEVPTSFSFSGSKPQKKKNDDRPGTSDSTTGLLAGQWGATSSAFTPTVEQHSEQKAKKNLNRHSLLYNHYEHSLNSLNDILDRDDKESLAELHQYLNSDVPSKPSQDPSQEEDGDSTPTPTRPGPNRKLSNASSAKSERRRSLPARTSMASINSEYSITSVLHAQQQVPEEDEVTTFQQRRRRAAKLTQFFGVNYRELINDVLESIETGVQSDRRNGTLREEEVEDLLAKLRKLKNKRQNFA